MQRYAIFLDFDSTLSTHNTISEENCRILKKAQELGHYVFISTGRNYQGIEPIASKFHKFSGYVSGLGSHIIMGDEVIYEKFFETDTVRRTVAWFLEKGITGIITCVRRGYVVNPTEAHLEHFTPITSLEYFDENCTGERFQKVESNVVDWSCDDMKFWKGLGEVFVHAGYTECCPSGVSKASAIEIVSKHLGIDKKNTIAMGDSANDADMISYAGIGVAMGNATDSIKEIADFITLSCEEHGVAYAIRKLILEKQEIQAK